MCRYGEGDLKALRWILHLVRDGRLGMLVTIDWDLPLSMSLFDAPVHVLIGRVFVDKSDSGTEPFRFDANAVELTRAKASKTFSGSFVPAFEMVRIPDLVAKYPSYDVRLWYVSLSFSL